MNYLRTLFLICIGSILMGCGERTSPQPSEAVATFPKEIHKDISDHVSIHATCVYPETFSDAIAPTVKQTDDTFWNKREHILDVFTEGKPVLDIIHEKYDEINFESNLYVLSENATLEITTGNILNYLSDEAVYIQNVLLFDERFDNYNGDHFQKKENLPFMDQKNAWNEVQSFLNKLGVTVSDHYVCYVMDAETMKEEESRIYQMYMDESGTSFEKKSAWTSKDDCYFFKTKTAWNGYSLEDSHAGEGSDVYNVSVIHNASGIIGCTIHGHYPLEQTGECTVQSPQLVADQLADIFCNMISEQFYEIQEISLCLAVIGYDIDTRISDLVPSWKCTVLVKDNSVDSSGYFVNYFFDAETLEIID